MAKYYDSGSLVVFYLVSLVWGINHIVKVSTDETCVCDKSTYTCTCKCTVVLYNRVFNFLKNNYKYVNTCIVLHVYHSTIFCNIKCMYMCVVNVVNVVDVVGQFNCQRLSAINMLIITTLFLQSA